MADCELWGKKNYNHVKVTNNSFQDAAYNNGGIMCSKLWKIVQ